MRKELYWNCKLYTYFANFRHSVKSFRTADFLSPVKLLMLFVVKEIISFNRASMYYENIIETNLLFSCKNLQNHFARQNRQTDVLEIFEIRLR